MNRLFQMIRRGRAGGGKLAIVNVSPLNAYEGQPYVGGARAKGGKRPYVYQLDEAAPPGLAFDTATGALTGTP